MITLVAIITTSIIIGSNMDYVYSHVSYVLAEDEMNEIIKVMQLIGSTNVQ